MQTTRMRCFAKSAENIPHKLTSSSLFVGKKVGRKDTLLSHQLSAKHIACTSKHERKSVKKVGTLDKAFAKVELSEVKRYKQLFHTAYAVAKHNCPFTDFLFICSIQEKNGVNLGNDNRTRDACVDFVKAISMTWRPTCNL